MTNDAPTPAGVAVKRRKRKRVVAPPSATTWRFYTALVVLLAVAGGIYGSSAWIDAYFIKEALPLQKPLHLMDVGKLSPEYSLHPQQPPPLGKELLESLGTEEYLQWVLVDESKDADDPTSSARVFITYYTGDPDLVPHNPRECLAAAGMQLESADRIEVEVATPDGGTVAIPIEVLTFAFAARPSALLDRGDDAPKLVVSYFFYANGDYVISRTGVRTQVNSIWDRYAFYAKIEASFMDGSGRKLASAAESKDAMRKLIGKIMPILLEDHFQDWDAVSAGQAPVVAGAISN